jgi:hypothetical protein
MGIMQIFWGDLEKRGRVRKNWTVEGGGGGKKIFK